MSLALEGVFETGTRARPLEVLVVNEDRGNEAQRTINAIEKVEGIVMVHTPAGKPLTLREVEEQIAGGAFGLALLFHEEFSSHIKAGHSRAGEGKAGISLIVDPTLNFHLLSSLKGTLQGIIERQALVERLPGLIVKRATNDGKDNPLETTMAMDTMQSRIKEVVSHLRFEILEQPAVAFSIITLREGAGMKRPTATEQNVPGYTIFGVFFIVLTLASSFIQEKMTGLFSAS